MHIMDDLSMEKKWRQRADSGRDSVQCHTDPRTCCSDTQGRDRGDWYFPNGDKLPFTGDIFERHKAQQVDLRHRDNGDISGIIYYTTVL